MPFSADFICKLVIIENMFSKIIYENSTCDWRFLSPTKFGICII